MGNLLSRSISTWSFASKVQNTLSTVQALAEALKVLSDPSGLGLFNQYLDPTNSDFRGTLDAEKIESATSVLRVNASRLAKAVVQHRMKTFARYLPDKRTSIIFYMPTPIKSPEGSKIITTGVSAPLGSFGTRQLALAFGGHTTRFFGLGFAIGARLDTQRQLFRMDWAKIPNSNHYPGDKDNADYWLDRGYEFHVPKEP